MVIEELFKVSYKPMPGWLVVKPQPQEEITKGGLLIPKNAVRREVIGTVLEVGAPMLTERGTEFRLTDPNGRPVQAGDTVVWMRHAGTGLEKDEEVHLIFLRFQDVIARAV